VVLARCQQPLRGVVKQSLSRPQTRPELGRSRERLDDALQASDRVELDGSMVSQLFPGQEGLCASAEILIEDFFHSRPTQFGTPGWHDSRCCAVWPQMSDRAPEWLGGLPSLSTPLSLPLAFLRIGSRIHRSRVPIGSKHMSEPVSKWAQRHGVELLWPEQFRSGRGETAFMSLGEAYDFQPNVCIDYGKFIERTPFFVLRPSTFDQLAATVDFLNEASISYKVRGTAHSAGGQVLFDEGAVLDLTLLNNIVEDSPETEQITVEGGISWLSLAQYLRPQGRRPITLTDNLRTTIGGTLAVGGFGDTTHLYGLQIASVTELTLLTPGAEVRQLAPPEKLLDYVLAGRGQLGIIARATLRTLQRPPLLSARVVHWNSIPDYVEDAMLLIEAGSVEFSRMRLFFKPELRHRNPVAGVLGNFQAEIATEDAWSNTIKHGKVNTLQQLDFLDHYSQDPTENWKLCSPAVEIIFPLPDGMKVWEQINRLILESGLFQYLNRGASIMVLRGDRRFPLAPLPDSEFCMMVAIRPAMPLQAVRSCLPLLERIQLQALTAGAKMYLMSIEPKARNFLEMQFGPALPELVSLKKQLDPKGLLNPGLLE
jgi:cytokinin dehydrogenase